MLFNIQNSVCIFTSLFAYLHRYLRVFSHVSLCIFTMSLHVSPHMYLHHRYLSLQSFPQLVAVDFGNFVHELNGITLPHLCQPTAILLFFSTQICLLFIPVVMNTFPLPLTHPSSKSFWITLWELLLGKMNLVYLSKYFDIRI